MGSASNHDALMIQCVKDRPNVAIPWLLMASWLYYIDTCELPILSDHRYDMLCKKVLQAYDRLQHRHKHLVRPDALRAGSLFYLTHLDYPEIVKNAAAQLSRQLQGQ